ncbi:MAG TPA: vWA domain-containing protein [Polyangiaceae bacterium]|nr:vWA domain-containing protein [Polyangiaceae bacterium]
MSIKETDARLTAYVFDELSGQDKVVLEAELAGDESARAKLTEIQRTVAALRFELSETKPHQLEAERREKIALAVRSTQRKRRQRRLLWGTASLAGMAALTLLYATSTSERKPQAQLVASAPTLKEAVGPTSARDSAAASRAPVEMLPSAPLELAPEAEPSPDGMRGVIAAAPGAVGRQNPGIGAAEAAGPALQRALGFGGAVSAVPSVSAGEWDDNANYREFMRWTASVPAPSAHRMDVRDRRFIVVRDSAGLGVPSCRVIVADESDRQTELWTTATGRAILFPHAEGLAGRTLSASTDCAGGARKPFLLSGPDGVVDLRTPQRRALPPEQSIDVAFILDSTGSMAEEIAAVKSTIQKVARGLSGSNVRIRMGLVEYKDRSDLFVTRVFPMSRDLELFSRQVAGVQAGGGGDMPESVNEALHVGIHDLAWDQGALAKLAFLVGDAPPHLDYPQDYDYALEAKEAAHRGIQIYTVAASGMDTLGQVVWRQVAQYTGATNLFVLRGGAGPQSVGAGDPKSSCGGTQTSYTSGNLDVLVLAKINGVLRSLERDPMRIAGLNTDENAKPCADRVLIGQ